MRVTAFNAGNGKHTILLPELGATLAVVLNTVGILH